jgi:hypothetical protein
LENKNKDMKLRIALTQRNDHALAKANAMLDHFNGNLGTGLLFDGP